ncbi:glycosyltransferase, partial [Pseudomonadota bacterium]
FPLFTTICKMDKGTPAFSIIITCYNYAEYLSRTIESVLLQQASAEIVIVDDASTDRTEEIAHYYGGDVRYYRLNSNQGAAASWNYGIQKSKGKYLCKLDADDWQLPGYLDTVYDEFELDENIGIVISSVKIYKNNINTSVEYVTKYDQTVSSAEFRKALLKNFFFRQPGTCLRKAVFERTSPPISQLYQIHDWELFLRGLQKWDARLIHKPLAAYRIHSNSITRTSKKKGKLNVDCEYWLDLAKTPGNYFVTNKDRKVLIGSMAILQLHGAVDSISIESLKEYFKLFLSSAEFAYRGGIRQLVRLIWFVTYRPYIFFSRLLGKLFGITFRSIGAFTIWMRRGIQIGRSCGISALSIYVNEELINNTKIKVGVFKESKKKDKRVYCNICEYTGQRFLTFCGVGYSIYDCTCPKCGSLTKLRGLAYLLDERLKKELSFIEELPGLRLLIAPDHNTLNLLSKYVTELQGVDLYQNNELVNFKSDVQSSIFLDDSVSFLFCFNVIEHVPNDKSALYDISRILKPRGLAIICVSINFALEKTIEYGESNCLIEGRYYDYGLDFITKLEQAGFSGEAYRLSAIVPSNEFVNLCLQDELVFIVRKFEDKKIRILN